VGVVVKIIVCVKQVDELADEFELTDDERGVKPEFLEPAANEWDIYAIEEAVRIKESRADEAVEVVVIAAGDARADEAIRRCLAMGADRAVRIEGVASPDPLSTARALAGVIERETPTLVFCGAQSADAGQAATGTALAELLGLPSVVVVKKLEWTDGGSLLAHRELEGGLVDVIALDAPALVTIQSGINAPRYSTLRAIRRAEQHEIDVRQVTEQPTPAYGIRRMFVPPTTNGAEMIDGDSAEIARRIEQIIKERLG
jgi:electron transfer flavoprotein beta subunit